MEEEKNTITGTENTAPAAEETKVSTGQVAEPQGMANQTGENTQSPRTYTTTNEDNSVSVPADDGDAAADVESKSLKRAEFEKLIKGDYKEFYEERIKDNLSRRFKDNSNLKQRLSESTEIVDMLYDRYNVEPGNIARLKSAIESDDAYLAAEADKRGMRVEDYKYLKKLENENRRYHMRQSQLEAAQRANEAVENWFRQSESVRESYPGFNIFEEAKNPSFVSLIKSGIDVKTAYEVVHHGEIMADIAQNAAREAEKKTADAIRNRAMRPAENGLSSSGSVIIKNDVSKLSPKERAEIAQRAARGERITF